MELYINEAWTQCYEDVYVAEAVAWSESGNHATIYTTGLTADHANSRLVGALRELRLIPEESAKSAGSYKEDSEASGTHPEP